MTKLDKEKIKKIIGDSLHLEEYSDTELNEFNDVFDSVFKEYEEIPDEIKNESEYIAPLTGRIDDLIESLQELKSQGYVEIKIDYDDIEFYAIRYRELTEGEKISKIKSLVCLRMSETIDKKRRAANKVTQSKISALEKEIEILKKQLR